MLTCPTHRAWFSLHRPVRCTFDLSMFIFEKNPKNLQKPAEYSPTDGTIQLPNLTCIRERMELTLRCMGLCIYDNAHLYSVTLIYTNRHPPNVQLNGNIFFIVTKGLQKGRLRFSKFNLQQDRTMKRFRLIFYKIK